MDTSKEKISFKDIMEVEQVKRVASETKSSTISTTIGLGVGIAMAMSGYSMLAIPTFGIIGWSIDTAVNAKLRGEA